MAADSEMQDHMDASAQVLNIFKSMAPFLDESLQLEANPGLQKRQRKDAGAKPPKDPQASVDVTKALTLMARLVLRQDQEIQSIRREDTFLLFFNNKEKTGALPLMVQTAAAWHQQMQQSQDTKPSMPLRQKLLQVLLQELLQRMIKLGEAAPQSDLVKVAIQNNVLLPDMKCPYLEWDQKDKQLKISQRTPLTLKKMVENVTEFLEMCTQPDLIHRFHSLPAQEAVTPWKLQLSLRADREFQLMQVFCQSSIWSLLGVTVKSHNHHQSHLASQLATTMGFQQTKGKNTGRGKGKTKQSTQMER